MPINPNPVNWFEIPCNDIARAATFYESVFGVELAQTEMGGSKMAWFPMEMGANRRRGNAHSRTRFTRRPMMARLFYIHVPEIDAALAKIDTAGGKTVLPRMSIGEHGFIAHFEDCEGNRVALHEAPAA